LCLRGAGSFQLTTTKILSVYNTTISNSSSSSSSSMKRISRNSLQSKKLLLQLLRLRGAGSCQLMTTKILSIYSTNISSNNSNNTSSSISSKRYSRNLIQINGLLLHPQAMATAGEQDA